MQEQITPRFTRGEHSAPIDFRRWRFIAQLVDGVVEGCVERWSPLTVARLPEIIQRWANQSNGFAIYFEPIADDELPCLQRMVAQAFDRRAVQA